MTNVMGGKSGHLIMRINEMSPLWLLIEADLVSKKYRKPSQALVTNTGSPAF